MTSSSRRIAIYAFLAVLVAFVTRAGDPIPDIDVVLEQIPGGSVEVSSPTGGFDEITLDVGKDFAAALSATALPPGWTLEAKGKTARLAGPAAPAGTPVRFELEAGSAERPKKISYQASLAGRKVFERRNETVELVPPQQVIGSLQGIVTMPTQVEPGKPMQMRVADSAALPPGGTWSLSGVVVAEEEEAGEPAEERRVALVVPSVAADEVSEDELREVAAVIAASGAPAGDWIVTPVVDFGESISDDEFELFAASVETDVGGQRTISNVMKAKHETAKTAIGNIRAMAPHGTPPRRPGPGGFNNGNLKKVLEVRPVDGAGGFLVAAGAGGEPSSPGAPGGADCASPEESSGCCAAAGGAWWQGVCLERLEPTHCPPEPIARPAEDTELVICGLTDFAVADGGDGGRTYTTVINTTRSHLKTRHAVADADGTVLFDLPEDLVPGGSLALRYLDLYGDVVVDVPSVPGVEIVEPTTDGGPRITDATPLTFAGQQACVCGSFPGPEAWNGLLLDGEALGQPVSASSRMAWIQLPATIAPGEHVVSGSPETGFPAEDRAMVRVVQIGGEIDSSKLQQLERTPMRLWVAGTRDPVELRVMNRTPSIVSIEGGDEQRITTSGGDPNMLERSVQGLSPGAFDIGYELAGEPCPCAPAETHDH